MTKIEWTDETWNPVTGCNKVSPGCRGCYAERMAARLQAMGNPRYTNGFTVTLHPDVLEYPLTWTRPRFVFVCSMSDLFHEDVPAEFIGQVFSVMVRAERHTFQVLTKRPERALELADGLPWPGNVWMGTSVESQDYAEERLERLAGIPARVRFVSAEPLLGPLDLGRWLGDVVQWVIVGGESGPRARPMRQEWALELLEQCDAAGIPAFLKQLGGRHGKRGGDQAFINGQTWRGMPIPLVTR